MTSDGWVSSWMTPVSGSESDVKWLSAPRAGSEHSLSRSRLIGAARRVTFQNNAEAYVSLIAPPPRWPGPGSGRLEPGVTVEGATGVLFTGRPVVAR